MLTYDPEPLREVYVAYHDRKRYEKLAKANLRRIVQWRWATGDMFQTEPFEKVLYNRNPRWLKEGQEPKVWHLEPRIGCRLKPRFG